MSALTTAELKALRSQFPLIAGSDLAYLDNAATTQKPQAVLDAVNHYYQRENANPFRGLYDLSLAATDAYEAARQKVANLIGNLSKYQLVYTFLLKTQGNGARAITGKVFGVRRRWAC